MDSMELLTYSYQKEWEIMGNPEHSRIIVCHLGNGASISAVKDGKSMNASMGLTPLQGLMMGTRCGDIDPSAVLFIKDKRGLTDEQINDRLNKKSGILGDFWKIFWLSWSWRRSCCWRAKAILALNIFILKLNHIGAYAAVMGGVDAIVFTGGIGENAAGIRELNNWRFRIFRSKNK